MCGGGGVGIDPPSADENRLRRCRSHGSQSAENTEAGRGRRNKGRRKRNPGQTSEGPCSGKPRGDHPVGVPRGSHKGSCQRLGWGEAERVCRGARGVGGRDRFPCTPPRAAAMSHLTDREALVKCVEASSRSRPCAMATLGPLRPRPAVTPGSCQVGLRRPPRRHCLHRYPGDREPRAHWLAGHAYRGKRAAGPLDLQATEALPRHKEFLVKKRLLVLHAAWPHCS